MIFKLEVNHLDTDWRVSDIYTPLKKSDGGRAKHFSDNETLICIALKVESWQFSNISRQNKRSVREFTTLKTLPGS
jgi:hypothetical protein